MRMMKQKGSADKADSYWDNLWGNPRDYQRSGMGCENTKKKSYSFNQ